jgi:thiol-disulfide isomerase/thioredoxin
MPATAIPADTAARAYRFQRFRTLLLIDDLTFAPEAPGPGDQVPAFDLPTLGGGRFSASDLGERPVLLAVGSRTCPVTESSGPVLRRLHAEYGDKVRFVLVNTREAHPGDLFGQPQTPEEKQGHAIELRRHHDIPFEVAVDDIDGTLHRALTPKPNSAYLLDPAGTIRYRAHWANDERGLRSALSACAQGRIPARDRSRAMVRPLIRATGHLPGVVRFAGRQAGRDVWIAAPPLAVLAWLSRLFRWLPEDRRGAAAAALAAGAVAVAAVVLMA